MILGNDRQPVIRCSFTVQHGSGPDCTCLSKKKKTNENDGIYRIQGRKRTKPINIWINQKGRRATAKSNGALPEHCRQWIIRGCRWLVFVPLSFFLPKGKKPDGSRGEGNLHLKTCIEVCEPFRVVCRHRHCPMLLYIPPTLLLHLPRSGPGSTSLLTLFSSLLVALAFPLVLFPFLGAASCVCLDAPAAIICDFDR